MRRIHSRSSGLYFSIAYTYNAQYLLFTNRSDKTLIEIDGSTDDLFFLNLSHDSTLINLYMKFLCKFLCLVAQRWFKCYCNNTNQILFDVT